MTSPPQSQMRDAALEARRSLDSDSRARHSQAIVSRFLRSRYFLSARTISCYLPMPDEVDTTDIFSRAWLASKRIFAPVTAPGRQLRFVEVLRKTPLVRSHFGLLEPVAGEEIEPLDLDTIVVPVVAFDTDRNRIGMGGGYYDTTFSMQKRQRSRRHPKLVGVAFECQKVRKIKANPWDIGLCEVITEA